MFKRPEELIMAVLALVWVVFVYYAATYFGAPGQTALLVAALNLIVAVVLFLLWLRDKHRWFWPLFLGAAAACWWPFLDWLAVSDIQMSGTVAETLMAEAAMQQPWYASWPFKAALTLLPAAAGYAFKFKQYRQRKNRAV